MILCLKTKNIISEEYCMVKNVHENHLVFMLRKFISWFRRLLEICQISEPLWEVYESNRILVMKIYKSLIWFFAKNHIDICDCIFKQEKMLYFFIPWKLAQEIIDNIWILISKAMIDVDYECGIVRFFDQKSRIFIWKLG